MSYRPWLDRDGVLRKLNGLPPEAFDLLIQVAVRICEDPYDRVISSPTAKGPQHRMAELGEFGYVEFTVDEAAGLVRVIELVWVG